MSVMPEGESLRNAIRFISEMRTEAPDKSIAKLIQEAGIKFDLTPKDADFLTDFYKAAEK
jgi:hypothetical protein